MFSNLIMEESSPPLRCFHESHISELFNDDGVQTVTSKEQVGLTLSIS